MIIAPISAIPSWEGYEYQGHIAIFITLVEIKTLLSNAVDIASSKYTLELEGAEDFSILDGNTFLSLHQVKAGKVSLNPNDKFNFLISVLQYNVTKGFYHILPDKTLSKDFVEETCQTIALLKQQFSCEIKNIDRDATKGEQNKAKKDFIIIEAISGNSEKGSKYNILKFVLASMGLSINKENTEKAIQEIITELNSYEQKLIVSGKKITDDNFVQLYPELFDGTTKVMDRSYLLISEIFDIIWPDWKISTDKNDTINYPKFIYGQILISLKQAMSESHEKQAKSCRISFSDLYSTIQRDFRKEMHSIAYQYYLVWVSIQESFETYTQKTNTACTGLSCNSCLDKSTCNLEKQKQRIASIKEHEMHSFLHKLMLKRPEIGKPNNLPSDNLIHRLLTSLLKDIDCLEMEEDHIIQAHKDGIFYRLTLDSCGEAHELQEQLSKEIMGSTEDKLLLFEPDVLITDQLNEEIFTINGHSSMILGKSEYEELDNITSDSIEKAKINYNKPKVLRLINRTTAKGELK